MLKTCIRGQTPISFSAAATSKSNFPRFNQKQSSSCIQIISSSDSISFSIPFSSSSASTASITAAAGIRTFFSTAARTTPSTSTTTFTTKRTFSSASTATNRQQKASYMFRGLWLLTDLDGTLVPTPHKAHGVYTPLNDSPCFPHITRWLQNGGNVCVITTADRRVVDQMYFPLRDVLKSIAAGSSTTSSGGVDERNMRLSDGTLDTECSNLLLSLYTGAVLYRCTAADGVVEVPHYTYAPHPTGGPLALSSTGATTMGQQVEKPSCATKHNAAQTCLTESTYSNLLQVVETVFLAFAEDVLTQRRPELLKPLSKRYKHMWATLRRHLQKRHQHEVKQKKAWEDKLRALTSGNSNETEQRKLAVLDEYLDNEGKWMAEYLKRRRALLTRVGIIRKEVLADVGQPIRGNKHHQTAEASTTSAPSCSTTTAVVNSNDHHHQETFEVQEEAHEARSEEIKTIAVELGAKAHHERLASASATVVRPLSTIGGNDVNAILHNMDSSTTNIPTQPSPTTATTATTASLEEEDNIRIAQVIIVGMPLKYYDDYFGPYQELFERSLEVQPIPQPNSVVFAKKGISKGTCVSYLDEAKWKRPNDNHSSKKEESSSSTSSVCFAGVADLQRSIGLGDNPHSADKELSTVPELTFISLESASTPRVTIRATAERAMSELKHTPSSTTSTTSSSGAVAAPPSFWESYASHMLHVGREEEGCADFLRLLMEQLEKHHALWTSATQQQDESQNRTSSVAAGMPYWDSAAEEQHSSASSKTGVSKKPLVSAKVFQHCVKIAATMAKMPHLRPSASGDASNTKAHL